MKTLGMTQSYIRGGGNNTRRFGFTLAETLITISIIGIVAAITLPTLVSNYKDKILISQAKKLYSETINGIKMYTAKNYCANESCLFDTSRSTDEVNREFFKMFEGATYCEKNNKKPICQKYMILANSKINNGYGQTGYGDNMIQPFIVLKTGSIIKIAQYTSCIREVETKVKDENGNYILDSEGNPKTQTVILDNCAYIYLDSNGQKGPNQRGADIFVHKFTSKNKIIIDTNFTKLLTEDKLKYTPYKVGVEY